MKLAYSDLEYVGLNLGQHLSRHVTRSVINKMISQIDYVYWRPWVMYEVRVRLGV